MDVALIGAGPRGLLLLSRLIALQQLDSTRELHVVLFDPYGIGGRVWQPTQPLPLLMNTAAQQITLFTDQTVTEAEPVTPGPNLWQWAQGFAAEFFAAHPLPQAVALAAEAKQLTANGYASRAFYGAYQQWFFQTLTQQLNPRVTVAVRTETVTAVHKQAHQFVVATQDTRAVYAAVVMALGHNENTLTREQQKLAAFAQENGRLYLPPGFPAEGDLSALTAEDTVVMRGLGLSFFDFVSRLTEGRGGRFTRNADQSLTYHPSGQEPTIVAGSRRGFPYHAKGRNEKGPGELVQPKFLTTAQLDAWQQQGHISGATFMQALEHEAEYVYYSLLLPQKYPTVDVVAWQLHFLQDPEAALGALPIAPADRLDWTNLTTPATRLAGADFHTAILTYLQEDIEEADKGTLTGPLTSALEVLRDMRDAIRQVITRDLLADDQYLDFFLRWFNGINNFLSIGPPVIRIEQLLALINAGIVTLLPPAITVTGKDGDFIASGGTAPDTVYRGTALIEARLPAANAPTAQNPLLSQLLHDDLATQLELQFEVDKRFQSGAILVDRTTNQLLDRAHQTQGNLFFWGEPTEGVNWLTSASPRPFVNDSNLRAASRIAAQIWATH